MSGLRLSAAALLVAPLIAAAAPAPAVDGGSTPIAPSPAEAPPAAVTFADPCGYLSATRVVACFSDPTASDAESSRIFQSLGALVEAAGPGDSIRFVIYHWMVGGYADQLRQAVIDAHAEGVDVKVILDEASRAETIDAFRTAGVPLVVCDDHDQPTDVSNRQENCLMWDYEGYYGPDSELPMTHTKMALFDIDGAKYVVAGSSNLGPWDYETAWNDMVRIRDTALHAYLDDWFDRIWADDWSGWDTDTEREGYGDPIPAGAPPSDLQEKVYLYPRVSNDPIAAQLSRVRACHSDGDGDGDWDKRVYIAISKWNDNQRLGIRDQLVRLKNAGCRVQVMVSDDVSTGWVSSLRSTLSGSSTSTENVRWVCKLHHKMVIIDAQYAGTQWREVVITGSNVWAKGSQLYSNELNLRFGGEDELTDDGAVRDYILHYERLWETQTVTSCA
ncbi:MAG TPA: phospholipase D-like domain-containing protein [Actinopolymorphaceae bacterium]